MKKQYKWTTEQRKKFSETMALKKAANHKKSSIIKRASHFYRLQGGQLIPVKVKKLVAWVIE
jgi:hypothetical protein